MMEQFVVKRSEWARGPSSGFFYATGPCRSCFVGLYLQYLGIPAEQMAYIEQPEDVLSDVSENILSNPSVIKKLSWIAVREIKDNSEWHNTSFVNDVININDDDERITDRERETLLKEKMAEVDIEVIFID